MVRVNRILCFLVILSLLEISPRAGGCADSGESSQAVNALKSVANSTALGNFLKTSTAHTPLTADDCGLAASLIQALTEQQLRDERSEEIKRSVLRIGDHSMPFFFRRFGRKPANGWSLYLSMHGGGGTAARVNDQQWENQKRLYQPTEGIYLAPRAPTNTWNLWHQVHIDALFHRLITNLVVVEDVNPDRIYLMGYSAGGDGVYQLAPRMADQFAAAAMMAGHPNETSPLGLRNLPFTIHVGEKDSGYRRNALAMEWRKKLADLKSRDPNGYLHDVIIHKGKGHWMDRQDAVALDWMARFDRKRYPERIVWKQDDVAHDRFYWLAIRPNDMNPRGLIVASREGQTIHMSSSDVSRVSVLLSDKFVDLDKEVVIMIGDRERFRGIVPRTISALAETIRDRGGLAVAFSARVEVRIRDDPAEK